MRVRKRRRRVEQPVKWLWEFSKRVVVTVTVLYVISVIFTAAVCAFLQDTATLGTLITESNETFRVVVGGYMIKAGVENALKIAKNKREGDTENDEPEPQDDEGELG